MVIDKGLIVDVGEKNHILKKFPNSEIIDYQEHLITAGFLDCHMHYPQTQIFASYGKRLLDWLNNFTFPEEMKFSDIKYASEIASMTLDLCLHILNVQEHLHTKKIKMMLKISYKTL